MKKYTDKMYYDAWEENEIERVWESHETYSTAEDKAVIYFDEKNKIYVLCYGDEVNGLYPEYYGELEDLKKDARYRLGLRNSKWNTNRKTYKIDKE